MELKQSQVTELKSMTNPPQSVKTIMTATLIVMGYPVKSAEDWKTCKAFLGQPNVLKSMTELDASKVTSLQVSQAREQLNGLSVEQIKKVSRAAGGLFSWVAKTMEAAESTHDGGAEKAA